MLLETVPVIICVCVRHKAKYFMDHWIKVVGSKGAEGTAVLHDRKRRT